MVYDFAENYSCRYQDEIQSVHWGHADHIGYSCILLMGR